MIRPDWGYNTADWQLRNILIEKKSMKKATPLESPQLYPDKITPAARSWLGRTGSARVLHVFDRVCNIVNQFGDLIAVQTKGVPTGPFSWVLLLDPPQAEFRFTDWVSGDSIVELDDVQFTIGPLSIPLGFGSLWDPQPDWSGLRGLRSMMDDQLPKLISWSQGQAPADSLMALIGRPSLLVEHDSHGRLPGLLAKASSIVAALLDDLETGDMENFRVDVRALAGLGPGLTPAGDDFLVGLMYALWSLWPEPDARRWGKALAHAAVPKTNQLSAAWIQAASAGEAGENWHAFFETFTLDLVAQIYQKADQILETGHTSGADAMTGFLATRLRMWESQQASIPRKNIGP